MKKIFKEAHKMTKEMVEKYGVDYQVQFGLCLAYLLENKEEIEMKGTEKQVKYANDIKKVITETIEIIKEAAKTTTYKKEEQRIKNEEKIISLETKINSFENAGDFISEYKDLLVQDSVERMWTLGRETNIAAIILKTAQNIINAEVIKADSEI